VVSLVLLRSKIPVERNVDALRKRWRTINSYKVKTADPGGQDWRLLACPQPEGTTARQNAKDVI
jgi:hypothetical protein